MLPRRKHRVGNARIVVDIVTSFHRVVFVAVVVEVDPIAKSFSFDECSIGCHGGAARRTETGAAAVDRKNATARQVTSTPCSS